MEESRPARTQLRRTWGSPCHRGECLQADFGRPDGLTRPPLPVAGRRKRRFRLAARSHERARRCQEPGGASPAAPCGSPEPKMAADRPDSTWRRAPAAGGRRRAASATDFRAGINSAQQQAQPIDTFVSLSRYSPKAHAQRPQRRLARAPRPPHVPATRSVATNHAQPLRRRGRRNSWGRRNRLQLMCSRQPTATQRLAATHAAAGAPASRSVLCARARIA